MGTRLVAWIRERGKETGERVPLRRGREEWQQLGAQKPQHACTLTGSSLGEGNSMGRGPGPLLSCGLGSTEQGLCALETRSPRLEPTRSHPHKQEGTGHVAQATQASRWNRGNVGAVPVVADSKLGHQLTVTLRKVWEGGAWLGGSVTCIQS